MGILPQTELLTWHDALTIAVIIFAITQFMETTRFRRYLFYLGWLRTLTVVLVGLPIILIMIANIPHLTLVSIISFIGSSLSFYFSYVFQTSFSGALSLLHDAMHLSISIPQSFWDSLIWILSSKATYQTISLLFFTTLILLYLAFLKSPHWFRPFFKVNLLDDLSWELLDNMAEEDLSALCKIIGSYLEQIMSLASTVPRHLPPEIDERQTFKNEFAIRCFQFINIDLSGDNFIVYISRQNVKFIMQILQYAKDYSFWRTGNSIFFDNLFVQLLKDENSVLTREFKLGGYSGIAQPLSNAIFKSMEIVDNYDVFGALEWGAGVSEITLSNTLKGLDMSLRKYFTTEAGAYIGTPSMRLGNTIERLSECYGSMCSDISKQNDEIWKNKHSSKMSSIMRFFDNFQYVLTPVSDTRWQETYNPIFSQSDIEVQKYSLTERIVDSFFNLYEGISWLKNEEYARMEAIELYWLIFQAPQNQMIKALQDNLLKKVKERIEENFKNHYPSIIKLFLNLYGGELYGSNPRSNNLIALYFKEIFKSRIIPAIRNDRKFREHNMPSDWQFDRQQNIYRMFHDEKKIIIDKALKKGKSSIIRKIKMTKKK